MINWTIAEVLDHLTALLYFKADSLLCLGPFVPISWPGCVSLVRWRLCTEA
jgi:hypothetical protein